MAASTAMEMKTEMKMTDSFSLPATLAVGTPRFDSLLIVRLSAMGDIIHTLPAASALRQAFPHATLGWLIEERWAELLCTLRYPRSAQAFPHATLGWLIEERWAELLCTLRYPRSGPRSPQRPLVDRVHTINLAEWGRAVSSRLT